MRAVAPRPPITVGNDVWGPSYIYQDPLVPKHQYRSMIQSQGWNMVNMAALYYSITVYDSTFAKDHLKRIHGLCAPIG